MTTSTEILVYGFIAMLPLIGRLENPQSRVCASVRCVLRVTLTCSDGAFERVRRGEADARKRKRDGEGRWSTVPLATGNPAILIERQDRRLCVPASRRVCGLERSAACTQKSRVQDAGLSRIGDSRAGSCLRFRAGQEPSPASPPRCRRAPVGQMLIEEQHADETKHSALPTP